MNNTAYSKFVSNNSNYEYYHCPQDLLDNHGELSQDSQHETSQALSLTCPTASSRKTSTQSTHNEDESSRFPDSARSTQELHRPSQITGDIGELRSVCEIPQKYRHIFSDYPSFNVLQSKALDHVLYSNTSLVISAPTGSGKTVIFELAIVHLLIKLKEMKYTGNFKIVYMAPVKALCSERYQDWQSKFSRLGIKCQEVTGDTVEADLGNLANYNLVLTTPEKWDSLTRKWRQNTRLVQVVKLFLIDEVHLLNEDKRGPTLEAVVSRMKTVQETLSFNKQSKKHTPELDFPIRFIAVSATIPNVEDVAVWLGETNKAAEYIKIGEEFRPVKLTKIVLGFHPSANQSPFVFDMNLSYRIRDILFKYSDGKPSLIFCSTRKGVQQTVQTIAKEITFHFSPDQRENILNSANNFVDKKLRDFVLAGVGCHHAGMNVNDRRTMEDLFRSSLIPVLVTTSTLAMGVNLPAHLVIIKSTQQYMAGVYQDYSDCQILQMIGRAGRPQFDTSATAVIMTREQDRPRYERLIEGNDLIESTLHRHLAEHLNSEIVLETITDKAIAMNWIRSTFLYVRAMKNPQHYGFAKGLTQTGIENKLQELCLTELNGLASANLVTCTDGMEVKPTETGRLMASFYLALDTMKNFNRVGGKENLEEMVSLISHCSEFSEQQLRRVEKRTLNTLNKMKDQECIRFPLKGVVRDIPMKVNVLIQASLGCLQITDHSLHQESMRIMRTGERVSKCLACCLFRDNSYQSLLSATILAKCFSCKLWEDSLYVTKQLHGIGPAYSNLLVSAGKTTFKSIKDANPRDLERIINKAPPLGNDMKTAVAHLPEYNLEIEVNGSQDGATVKVTLVNDKDINDYSTAGPNHWLTLLVGDDDNHILLKERFTDSLLLQNSSIHTWRIILSDTVVQVFANLISDHWVGIDKHINIKTCKPRKTQTASMMKKAIQQYVTNMNLPKIVPPIKKQNVPEATITKPKKLSIIEQIRETSSKFTDVGVKSPWSKSPRMTQTKLDQYMHTPAVKNKLPATKEFLDQENSVYEKHSLQQYPPIPQHVFEGYKCQSNLSESSFDATGTEKWDPHSTTTRECPSYSKTSNLIQNNDISDDSSDADWIESSLSPKEVRRYTQLSKPKETLTTYVNDDLPSDDVNCFDWDSPFGTPKEEKHISECVFPEHSTNTLDDTAFRQQQACYPLVQEPVVMTPAYNVDSTSRSVLGQEESYNTGWRQTTGRPSLMQHTSLIANEVPYKSVTRALGNNKEMEERYINMQRNMPNVNCSNSFLHDNDEPLVRTRSSEFGNQAADEDLFNDQWSVSHETPSATELAVNRGNDQIDLRVENELRCYEENENLTPEEYDNDEIILGLDSVEEYDEDLEECSFDKDQTFPNEDMSSSHPKSFTHTPDNVKMTSATQPSSFISPLNKHSYSVQSNVAGATSEVKKSLIALAAIVAQNQLKTEPRVQVANTSIETFASITQTKANTDAVDSVNQMERNTEVRIQSSLAENKLPLSTYPDEMDSEPSNNQTREEFFGIKQETKKCLYPLFVKYLDNDINTISSIPILKVKKVEEKLSDSLMNEKVQSKAEDISQLDITQCNIISDQKKMPVTATVDTPMKNEVLRIESSPRVIIQPSQWKCSFDLGLDTLIAKRKLKNRDTTLIKPLPAVPKPKARYSKVNWDKNDPIMALLYGPRKVASANETRQLNSENNIPNFNHDTGNHKIASKPSTNDLENHKNDLCHGQLMNTNLPKNNSSLITEQEQNNIKFNNTPNNSRATSQMNQTLESQSKLEQIHLNEGSRITPIATPLLNVTKGNSRILERKLLNSGFNNIQSTHMAPPLLNASKESQRKPEQVNNESRTISNFHMTTPLLNGSKESQRKPEQEQLNNDSRTVSNFRMATPLLNGSKESQRKPEQEQSNNDSTVSNFRMATPLLNGSKESQRKPEQEQLNNDSRTVSNFRMATPLLNGSKESQRKPEQEQLNNDSRTVSNFRMATPLLNGSKESQRKPEQEQLNNDSRTVSNFRMATPLLNVTKESQRKPEQEQLNNDSRTVSNFRMATPLLNGSKESQRKPEQEQLNNDSRTVSNFRMATPLLNGSKESQRNPEQEQFNNDSRTVSNFCMATPIQNVNKESQRNPEQEQLNGRNLESTRMQLQNNLLCSDVRHLNDKLPQNRWTDEAKSQNNKQSSENCPKFNRMDNYNAFMPEVNWQQKNISKIPLENTYVQFQQIPNKFENPVTRYPKSGPYYKQGNISPQYNGRGSKGNEDLDAHDYKYYESNNRERNYTGQLHTTQGHLTSEQRRNSNDIEPQEQQFDFPTGSPNSNETEFGKELCHQPELKFVWDESQETYIDVDCASNASQVLSTKSESSEVQQCEDDYSEFENSPNTYYRQSPPKKQRKTIPRNTSKLNCTVQRHQNTHGQTIWPNDYPTNNYTHFQSHQQQEEMSSSSQHSAHPQVLVRDSEPRSYTHSTRHSLQLPQDNRYSTHDVPSHLEQLHPGRELPHRREYQQTMSATRVQNPDHREYQRSMTPTQREKQGEHQMRRDMEECEPDQEDWRQTEEINQNQTTYRKPLYEEYDNYPAQIKYQRSPDIDMTNAENRHQSQHEQYHGQPKVRSTSWLQANTHFTTPHRQGRRQTLEKPPGKCIRSHQQTNCSSPTSSSYQQDQRIGLDLSVKRKLVFTNTREPEHDQTRDKYQEQGPGREFHFAREHNAGQMSEQVHLQNTNQNESAADMQTDKLSNFQLDMSSRKNLTVRAGCNYLPPNHYNNSKMKTPLQRSGMFQYCKKRTPNNVDYDFSFKKTKRHV